MAEVVEVTIEKLAGLGDGLALRGTERIFVPYTVPEDVVCARIIRKTADATYAQLESVVTPGPGRIAPVCRHFGICGGCSLQQLSDNDYTQFKQQMAREAVRKAGFDPELTRPLVRLPIAGRRRVELKVQDGALGYYAARSHRLVDIAECKVLEPGLEALVMELKNHLQNWPGLQTIQINGLDQGYDILLCGVGSKAWQVAPMKDVLRITAREGDTDRTLLQSGPALVNMGGVAVEAPAGAFLQASREAQALMTELVAKAASGAAKVLDLFAGLGSYGFALADGAQVTAVEGETAMVNAMRVAGNDRDGFKAMQRDLFANPVPAAELSTYDAVILNPPRVGAKEQSAMLAGAKTGCAIMVSCNPATFARDGRLLKEGGWRMEYALPIDQFAYSHHLEIIFKFAK